MAETKADLQLAYASLKQRINSLKKETETKNNQLCGYRNHLGLIKEREVHYLHEIDDLQTREKPEVNILCGRIKLLQEELSRLHENFGSEMLKHDDELHKLQSELKMRSEDAVSTNETLPTITDDLPEENLLLEKELQIFSNHLCEKQLCLDQLEEQNRILPESIDSLRLELEHIRESVECKKQEIAEAYNLMNNLEETLLVMKAEFDDLKGASINSISDENSLFAEVNDRRLKLQETLLNLSEKCNKMKIEVSKKQKQISTLRLHNEDLTNLLKNDPIEYQQDYKTLIDTYISRISILENLSKQYQKLLAEKKELFLKGLPNNIMEFLNNINEKNRKVEEELNEILGMELRAQKMMSIQLKEINLNIEELKSTTDQLHGKLFECENAFQKIKLQCSNLHTEMKETNKNENSGVFFAKPNHEDKLVEEWCKENSSPNANTSKIKLNKKTVNFAAETKSSSNHVVRKGRKVLQCKSVHIPTLIKKK